jgi:hypothetical protein
MVPIPLEGPGCGQPGPQGFGRLWGSSMEAFAQTADDMAGYWRKMAEDALALAEDMMDPESKRSMLEIAAGYRQLASGSEPANPDQVLK